jgi:hypothetical protein
LFPRIESWTKDAKCFLKSGLSAKEGALHLLKLPTHRGALCSLTFKEIPMLDQEKTKSQGECSGRQRANFRARYAEHVRTLEKVVQRSTVWLAGGGGALALAMTTNQIFFYENAFQLQI